MLDNTPLLRASALGFPAPSRHRGLNPSLSLFRLCILPTSASVSPPQRGYPVLFCGNSVTKCQDFSKLGDMKAIKAALSRLNSAIHFQRLRSSNLIRIIAT